MVLALILSVLVNLVGPSAASANPGAVVAQPPDSGTLYSYDHAPNNAPAARSSPSAATNAETSDAPRSAAAIGAVSSSVASVVAAETGQLALPESSLPTAAEAQQLVQDADPVGSALKDDIFHRAATFASEDIGSNGSVYRIVGGDGVEKTLIQMPGEVNDIAGRFEWIVNDQGELVHQMFVKGGSINGLPITP